MRALLLAVVCAACGGEYAVRLSFDPANLAEDVTHVQVAIVEGCSVAGDLDGDLRGVVRSITYEIGETAPALGDLDPGSYGFVGRAWNAECRIVAASCRPITVEGGGEGTLTLTLAPFDGNACPSGCMNGECVDAFDAGVVVEDVSLPDGVTTDTPPDTPEDAGGACIGEGLPCDTNGTCHDGLCCTGCWDEAVSTCRGGDEASACGSGGEACATCECPLDSCDAGACRQGTYWDSFDAGDGFVCAAGAAIGDAPRLYCWGRNDFGQSAVPGGEAVRTPTRVAGLGEVEPISISLAPGAAFVVGDDGHLWSWGHDSLAGETCNEPGMLGRSADCIDANPAWVGVETDYCSVGAAKGLSTTTSITRASRHVCAIRETGRLVCWGGNLRGQLGLGNIGNLTAPSLLPEVGWLKVATGGATTCALRSEFPVAGCPDVDDVARLYCWGQNQTGALGTGEANPVARRRPGPSVLEDTFFHRAFVSSDAVCGWRAGGDLNLSPVCWGDNEAGQLALPAGSPMEPGPMSILMERAFSAVGAAAQTFYAVSSREEGEGQDLFGWGSAENGLLPPSPPCATGTCARTPVVVAPESEYGVATTIAGGRDVTCFINATGVLYCFGQNDVGQLGQGDLEPRSEPVPICIP